MNKKSMLYILLDLVFLAVFNTVFFSIGCEKYSASVWVSYAFIHIAYLLVIATPIVIRKGSSASLFGATLYSISAVYFFVELIVGLVFMLIGSDSIKTALVVQVIIAGIYAIILISNMIANEHTAEAVERREKEVEYIKEASAKVKLLIDKASDRKANKAIEKVYDSLHSSPTKSDSSVTMLEMNIVSMITELEGAVKKDDADAIGEISKKIVSAIEERNSKLKTA